MEFDSVFWGATIVFLVVEELISHAIADRAGMPKKGLFTNVAAAAILWGLSFLVYYTASAITIDCASGRPLADFDFNGCMEYAKEVITVGDVLNTTVGLNPIVAATVIHLLLESIAFVRRRFR